MFEVNPIDCPPYLASWSLDVSRVRGHRVIVIRSMHDERRPTGFPSLPHLVVLAILVLLEDSESVLQPGQAPPRRGERDESAGGGRGVSATTHRSRGRVGHEPHTRVFQSNATLFPIHVADVKVIKGLVRGWRATQCRSITTACCHPRDKRRRKPGNETTSRIDWEINSRDVGLCTKDCIYHFCRLFIIKDIKILVFLFIFKMSSSCQPLGSSLGLTEVVDVAER